MNDRFVDSSTEDIISQLAQDETGKRQYYRPIYSLHKWWARRPGALFRSIILRATRPDAHLFASHTNGSFFQKSDYFADHDLDSVIVLDPFMGGGTTLVEASRLGARVVGCDLNPVSWWIVRETLKPIDLRKLEFYFHQLEQTAGEKIKALYKTDCVFCHTPADGMYAFWIRYVNCPHCHTETYLFKRTLLNEGLSRNKPPSRTNPAIAFCPYCFALNEWYGKGTCTCQACARSFDPLSETFDEGDYTCQHCQRSHALIETMRAGQILRERLIAIEYWCHCRKARLYKSPDANDLANLAHIQATWDALGEHVVLPKQKILEGASSVRWRAHNYEHYHQIFNTRQLLAFNYLIEGIRAISEEEYRNVFFTVFSNALEYNNMMTPYNYPHRKLHHLFNYHAMPLTTTPVENAVWGAGEEGAGTFVNCYQRYRQAKAYANQPFDKFKDAHGTIQTIYAQREKIAPVLVSSFDALRQTPHSALLLCGDSAHLSEIPNASVDLVITDPPYFDSIHYSELSNFFYVWLRELVSHPYFAAENVPTQAEAIVNDGMAKGEQEYQNLLAAVFKECARVLKANGKLIFTFHHTKWRAWWTVLMALASSGFRVVDSFPVMSEYKVNPHIRNKQTLNMDLVLVCAKKTPTTVTLATAPAEILRRAMQELNSPADHSDNKLFLHFMGELLRTASASQNGNVVNYDWFADALTHFDDFLQVTQQSRKQVEYTSAQPRQLHLLESKKSMHSKRRKQTSNETKG
jgi:putative DNA methylase